MTSQVTQCPKCSTSFRVTETQLHIANGAVRCGSCLNIFDAPDHWLNNDTCPSALETTQETSFPDSQDSNIGSDDWNTATQANTTGENLLNTASKTEVTQGESNTSPNIDTSTDEPPDDLDATAEIEAITDDPDATAEFEAITNNDLEACSGDEISLESLDSQPKDTNSSDEFNITAMDSTVSTEPSETVESDTISDDHNANTERFTAISDDPDTKTEKFNAISDEHNLEEDEDAAEDDFDEDTLFNDTAEHPALNHISEQKALDQIFDDEDDDHYLIDDAHTIEVAHRAHSNEDPDFDKFEQEAFVPGVNYEQAFDDDDAVFDDNTPLFNDTGSYPRATVEEGMISAEDLNLPDDSDSQSGAYSDTFLDLDSWDEDSASVFKELDNLGDTEESSEEEWAEKLLEEDDLDTPAQEEPSHFEEISEIFETQDEPKPYSTLSDTDLFDSTDEEEEEDLDLPLAAEDEFVLSKEPTHAGKAVATNNRDLLASIELEPVVISTKLQNNLWRKRAWTASIVVALLAISTQYLVFNFDRMSQDKQIRPLLGSACSIFGCELPTQGDVRQILSSNLMVRSHPEVDDALVVDAIITNRAKFKQQFPVMELRFTDLSGNIVAGRRFMPEEYLAGELTGARLMPTRQPIHISLEIVDPGQEAVNYQLYFHSPRGG